MGDTRTGAALTCVSCRMAFTDVHLQREHYKTDWHRYNLKRKITGFAPVTEEQFNQKVAAYREEAATEKNAVAEVIICECCNKQFQSNNAYDNHISSKKHKENEARSSKKDAKVTMKKASFWKRQPTDENNVKETGDSFNEEDIDEEHDDDDESDGWITDHGTDDEDFDETKGIPKADCLFCNHSSDDVEANLVHMSVLHGFFLPDAEFCTDVDGMLHYLGLKVGSGNMCLMCNERKRFSSLDACQKHMRDKGHCRIAHSVEEMIEFEDFYDYSSMYPDGDDGESSDIVLADDGYTLTLPSGAKIGHRSLLRYYRQHLKPFENTTRNERRGQEALRKVIGQYKALGWTGTSGPVAVQRAKDIRYMKKINSKNLLRLGLNNNKLFSSRGRSDQ